MLRSVRVTIRKHLLKADDTVPAAGVERLPILQRQLRSLLHINQIVFRRQDLGRFIHPPNHHLRPILIAILRRLLAAAPIELQYPTLERFGYNVAFPSHQRRSRQTDSGFADNQGPHPRIRQTHRMYFLEARPALAGTRRPRDQHLRVAALKHLMARTPRYERMDQLLSGH